MRFKSNQRLRRTAEYQTVRTDGRTINCGSFLFSFMPKAGEPPLRRLGVIASRRVGNAVLRNRAKRRLRELFRIHQDKLPSTGDLVLIARRSLPAESFGETETRFLKACHRVSSLQEPSPK
jgi:ribonuclease P protein component